HLPAEVAAKLKEYCDRSVTEITHGGDDLPRIRKQLFEDIKNRIEEAALWRSSQEKIPLFDHLLNVGKSPISKTPGFEQKFMRERLRLDPNSPRGKFLSALLKSIESQDRTPVLAYLYSTQQADGSFSIV